MADTKEIKPFVQLSVQGATKTTELTDFPDDLTGQGGKVPRVKEDGTGFELALPAESHDMASPVGATYLVSDFRKLVAGEGYRLPLNSGTDYVNLTSVGLTNRPDAKSAFIEKISEHLYQLVINENTSNGEFHDIYYLTLGDVLDDSLGLGNTGTTFNKDKTVFDLIEENKQLTTKLNNLIEIREIGFGANVPIGTIKKVEVDKPVWAKNYLATVTAHIQSSDLEDDPHYKSVKVPTINYSYNGTELKVSNTEAIGSYGMSVSAIIAFS